MDAQTILNENKQLSGRYNYYTVDVNYTDDCTSYRWSLLDHANVTASEPTLSEALSRLVTT